MRSRLLVFLLTFVAYQGLAAGENLEPSARYFASPEESVTRCTDLMRSENWPELARYYDLTGTSVARSELESGVFFLRTNPPENAHPGGLWKFREPFAPGFTFISAEPAGPTGVVAVTVGIAIDEGGGMVQRGRTTYHLRGSTLGYRLLPASVSAQIASATGDPAYALTGGISRTEAAWRAHVDDKGGSWHAVYSAALSTWFFTSANGTPVALERVAMLNPPLPAKAPPGFQAKPWRWAPRALPAMDVIAIDELCTGPGGTTRFKLPMEGFDDLRPEGGEEAGEIDVPREKIWAVLDRARERGLRVRLSVDSPASAGAHAVLSLVPQ